MPRSLFLTLAVIALGTACTLEQQCQQIALGSSSAQYGTFAPCFFQATGVQCDYGDAGPPPDANCLPDVLDVSDVVGQIGGGDCAVPYSDANADVCIVWERGGKVVGREWGTLND